MTTETNFKISLRPMSDEEFSAYLKIALPEYASEKKKGENLTDEQAMKVATDSYNELLPDGVRSADQHLFSVVENATKKVIGTLWFCHKTQPRSHAWIYDIVLNEASRGKGYGSQTMQLAEEEVLKRGIHSIGLHVFGHNKTAMNLYEKVGFRTTNRIMVKDLT